MKILLYAVFNDRADISPVRRCSLVARATGTRFVPSKLNSIALRPIVAFAPRRALERRSPEILHSREDAQTTVERRRVAIAQPALALMSRQTPAVAASSVVDIRMYVVAITLGAIQRHVLLRKEVIQPHLPIRLPCYDFVPLT
jgi:hypothetical protein